ncbi:hypothetical protein [Tritonibacter horizontis]|uniref:Dihydroorotate dehydrogenase n=1 Tax=Tritonibacter horizontis TaxID=1768241 RepID=A0A132BV30_9RHOB|nr:hypothetical protein [Tritonibacter horizontis]KUP92046.1 hypothetical protein TRIHO_30630 [Tritonibacter horizontis]
MTDHHTERDETDKLEALFSQARATPVALPDHLVATILAEAETEQSRWQATRATRAPATGGGALSILVAALGGWASVSGMVAASCTGLWIGFAGPEAILSLPGLNAIGQPTVSVSGEDYAAYETFDLATVLAEDMQ